MKIVRYGNDCVILDTVLGVEAIERQEEELVKKNALMPDEYKIIIVSKIMFYNKERNLSFKMPSKEEAIKAYNKIIDFLQNDEKLLDLTNRETQCS